MTLLKKNRKIYLILRLFKNSPRQMMHHSVSHHAGLYLISKQKDISNKKTKKVGAKLSKCIIWWATNYKAETQNT